MPFFEKHKPHISSALKLALPIITGQLGIVLMGFFDTIQVGGLGSVYMGACGLANGVYFLFMLLGMGILFSVSPLVSEAFGEKNAWKAIGVLKSALKVALVIAVLFYLVMLGVIWKFSFFRESPTVTGLAQQFLSVLNYSTPMLMLYTMGKQFMDGTGRTRVSMTITLVGLVINVSLNQLLIYGAGGFPKFGIVGSALATGIARTAMALMICGYILFDRQVKELMRQYSNQNDGKKSYVKQILEIGIPSGLQSFFEVGAFSACQIMTGWLGETSLAAFQVAISMASITFMLVSGFAAAGTILMGYAFGARDNPQMRISANVIYMLSFCCQFIFALIFISLNHLLPTIYTADPQVISIAGTLLIFAALFQLGDGFQVVGAGLLRGMQDVKVPSAIAFASYWLVMVPLAYLLAFHFQMGVKGIWLAFVVGLTLSATLMYTRLRYMLGHVRFLDL
ncbi:MAG TPA: MATE family efflux transporter [Chitinophagales bacterium]|nr:MATE family efflux transporter [Chitinophagales bacterium]